MLVLTSMAVVMWILIVVGSHQNFPHLQYKCETNIAVIQSIVSIKDYVKFIYSLNMMNNSKRHKKTLDRIELIKNSN